MQQVETTAVTPEIGALLSRELGLEVVSVEGLAGGRNSRVWKVTCQGTRHYVAKGYFRHSSDNRDRLNVEYACLEFLWENGVRCVPKPIVADRAHGWAVYEYIDGQTVSSEEVTASDITVAVDFLARLRDLTTREGSHLLPSASEACFSVQAVVRSIERRFSRLVTLQENDGQRRALRAFLVDEFLPRLQQVTRWCRSRSDQSGVSFTSTLGVEARTLSPSDFGFHNALRRTGGGVVFLDFEYFGWDDPAKMIADFLLHPAMALSEGLKRRFVAALLGRFEEDGDLARRVEIVYPLFGLKWCLILLNEFVPGELLRRGFASGSELESDELRARQLSKARRMLGRIMGEYAQFPYGN